MYRFFLPSLSLFAHACKCEIEALLTEETNQPTHPLICGLFLAVTNKKPTQASITKVKQFEGSTSFVRRSQWMLEQLRQVNGIDPNRVSDMWSVEWRWPLHMMTLIFTLAMVVVVWVVFNKAISLFQFATKTFWFLFLSYRELQTFPSCLIQEPKGTQIEEMLRPVICLSAKCRDQSSDI